MKNQKNNKDLRCVSSPSLSDDVFVTNVVKLEFILWTDGTNM